jgi:demethylmenaquinone methyltransferase/2-methoxy-6-polyprenyl-1,4-benzoquinol methylase
VTHPRPDTPPAGEKASLVRGIFARIAGRYDLLNALLSLGLHRPWRRRAAAHLDLHQGSRVVDLCCGTGELTAALADLAGPENVVGVDFVPEMLERARLRHPELRFVEGDALATGLPGGAFDGASVAFALRNVEDVEALFREMARLIRPGGRVVSLELTRPPGLLGCLHGLVLRWIVPLVGRLFSGQGGAYRYLARSIAEFLPAEEVADLMRRAGLEEIRIVPLTGGIVTLHLGRRPAHE